MAAPRLEYAIADVAGVQSFRRSDSRTANPSAQGLTLRGIGGNASSRTQVLHDGIPLEDPFFGFIPFVSVPPGRLESITVLKGAAVGSFGSGVAGRIDLRSASLAGAGVHEASLATSDTGTVSFTGALGVDLAAGTGELSVAIDEGPGYWTTPQDQRDEASVRSAFFARSANARYSVALGPGTLATRIKAFRDDRTLRFSGADSRIEGIDGDVRYLSERWDASLFAKRRDFSNRVISSTSFRPVLDQYRTPSTGAGLSVVHAARPWLSVGTDLSTQSGVAYERAISSATGAVTARRENGGRTTTAGLVVQALRESGPWRTSGTLRLDRWRLTDTRQVEEDSEGRTTSDVQSPARSEVEWSGRVGTGWSNGDLRLTAAAYRTFRSPTLNELFRGFTVFPVVTLANAALEAERLSGVDAGLEVSDGGRWALSATLFASRLHDAIANVTISPNLRQRRNIEAISSYGVETAVRYNGKDWSVFGSATLLDPSVRAGDESDGLRPAQTPTFSSSLTAEKRTGRVRGSLTLRHVGKAYEDDLNLYALPAATTVDLVARTRLRDGVELFARASNIFDQEIVTRNQAGSLDLAAGREISIGLALGK